MKKRKFIVRLLRLIAVIVIFAGMTVLVRMAGKSHSELVCKKVDVCICDSSTYNYVTRQDVEKALASSWNGMIVGRRAETIDLGQIEVSLLKRRAIRRAETFITADGVLHVEIFQRRPVIKFCIREGKTFYMDKEGCIFELSSGAVTSAITVSGDMCHKKGWREDLLELCLWIDGSQWKDKIKEIRCREDGELTIIPALGKEKFIFGGPGGYREKFRLIEKYYNQIKKKDASDLYRSVNVKFENQIICRK